MPVGSQIELGESRAASSFDVAMAVELDRVSLNSRLIFSAIYALVSCLILPWTVAALWLATLLAWEMASLRALRWLVAKMSEDRANWAYAVANLTGSCFYHFVAFCGLASGTPLGVAIGATWLCGSFVNSFVYFGSNRRLLWSCLIPGALVAVVAPIVGHGLSWHDVLIGGLILTFLAAARGYALDHNAVVTTLADRQVALTDLERKLSVAVEASGDGLFEIDLISNEVRFDNNWSAMLGYGSGELVSPASDWRAFVHPDDMPRLAADYDDHFEGRTQHTNIEVRLLCRDGTYKWVLARARLVERTAEGKSWRTVGTTVDLSARKALEQQLETARDLAEAANAAKSVFIANMSHEIRTPLNGVIGVAGALARTELAVGQREMVGLIQSSGQVLERLLGDILDQAKMESGQVQLQTAPFDLRIELEAAAELMRARADEKGIRFSVVYGEAAAGRFEGDAVRIRQVISNLASNAIKFTEAGTVTITVEVDEPEAAGAPSRVRIAVADTGIGFSEEVAGRLFGRFVQADGSISRQFGGTGLGLAISKSLTELMGGRIEARSQPGVGSVFTVEIPLARVIQEAVGDSDLGKAQNLERLRILLAEDHAINQRVVQLILGPLGVELTVVDNGAEAVAAVEAGGFDLILMDMQMPVMDGLTATRAIRALERRAGRTATPIAMFTANAKDEDRAKAAEAGADHHIAKPITPESLIDGIETALAQASWGAPRALAS